jgi:hypothetical protein
MLYCIYYSKKLLDFFNEYIIESINLKGQDLISIYVPRLYQVIPFLIIIVLAIILTVMIIKKKPMMFYIINIASCIYTIIIVQVAKSTLNNMESALVDARAVRLIRDFIMISFIIQIICTTIVLIRSIGFDVKKFDFKEDLKELEINEEDREEFEVEFNIDQNKAKRNARRKIRYLKYAYKENKLLVHIVSIVFVFLIIIFGTYTYIKKEKPVKENVYITNNGITLKVNKSYITATDYKGNIISEDSIFVILQIDIKTNSSNVDTLDIATAKLSVGEYSFIPTYDYKDTFFDFGDVYLSDKLSSDYQTKILVYQIPKQLKDENIEFHFVNKTTMDKRIVKLGLNDLTLKLDEDKLNLNEELDFKDSILSGYKLTINNFDIQKKYKLEYNFCYNNDCFTSYEYIVPSINTNIDKSILRLEGVLTIEKPISKLNDLYDIISSFGTIYYSIDGNLKTNSIALNKLTSTKKKENNIFYIEVPSELENASSISIKFKIRNKIYEYVLK